MDLDCSFDRPACHSTCHSARRHPRASEFARRLLAGAIACFAVAACLVPAALAQSATQAATQPGPTEIDVVFVLDNSGSMKTNDPEFLTRRAVADFTDALAGARDVEGRVGIVLFDGDARLVQRLAPASDIASTRGLDRTLAELDFSGQRTNSPAGIERALYELRERGRADARRAIIFLSDGRIDTGDPARDFDVAAWLREDLAGASREEGILIFGVAFTEGADYQLMQELSRRTDAQYYRAFAPGELITVVDDVLARLATPSDYALATADIQGSPDRPSESGGANVPPVASAPLAETDSEGFAPGLLGWIPALLFMAGAGLLLRGRLAGGAGAPASGPAPPAQLLDLGGHIGEAGRAYALSPERTAIGRDPHNEIVLDSDTISSEHALIEYRDGRYWLQDLRSTNGTRRADVRLKPDERVPLKGGDAVRFADIEMMFAMKGYVPVGATAYLSSSTVPPANWTALSHTTDPGVATPSAPPTPAAGAHPAGGASLADSGPSADSAPPADAGPSAEADGASPAGGEQASPPAAMRARRARANDTDGVEPADAPSGEVQFAEQRVRIDPASVLDLDEELGDVTPQSDAAPPAVPEDTFARVAIANAEAVLEDLDGGGSESQPGPVVAARPAIAEPVQRDSNPGARADDSLPRKESTPEDDTEPERDPLAEASAVSGPDAEIESEPVAQREAAAEPEREAAAEPENEAASAPEREVEAAAEPEAVLPPLDRETPTAKIQPADVPSFEPLRSEAAAESSRDFLHPDEEITVPGGLDDDAQRTIPGAKGAEDLELTIPGTQGPEDPELTAPGGFGSDDAERTIPGDGETDPCVALRRGLDFHLTRVAEISPAFTSFVREAFKEEIREALPIAANDLIEMAGSSGRIEERRYTQSGIRFLICGVAGDMETARDAFVTAHGGFTRLLMEELQSEAFRAERCRILAILTCGRAEGPGAEPWVSLSVVPDEGEDPRIDLLSYEFLTDAERQEIEPNIDPEVSQSGLA